MLAITPSAAMAVQPGETLADPALERRARAISADLRCLVCQNQSIDDSDAPLARDLRLLVREQLEAGKDDAQVRDYLVARYGDFILLKPPVRLGTAMLWGAPFAIVLIGAVALLLAGRRLRPEAAQALSAEESKRLQDILDRQG